MNRAVLLLLAWLLLSAAAPVPVRLTPERPVLGMPLLLTAELPEGCELAGLPPLAPFELLVPPRTENGTLRLLLLPMRPGDTRIPSLPLRQAGRQLSTEEVPLTVADGIAADARPAPLKALPGATSAPSRWMAAAFTLLAVTAGGVWWLYRRRAPRPPRLEELSGEELLAELQRRLATLSQLPVERREVLASRLERLRFAPEPTCAAAIEQLRDELLSLCGETA